MKVAILGARSYPPKMSGIDNQMFELSNRLAARGHEVFIFTAGGSAGPDGVHVMKVPQIKAEFGDVSMSYLTCNAFSLPYVARMVKRHRIDVIHANNPIAGMIGAAVKRLTGRPLVYTIRGTIPDNIRARGSRVGRLLSVFEKRALSQADAVTAITPYILKTTMAWHRCKKHGTVIPNGIDLEKFGLGDGEKIRMEFGLRGWVLLFIGRLVGVKGVETLLDAAGCIKDGAETRIVIVGDGPLMDALKLRAGKNIVFTGMRRDIPDFLAACDALILPSFHEGFPNVVLEAMAAGRPVIASRIMSMPDIVRDGKTGLLFEPGNSAELAEKISAMLENKKKMKEMGRAALRASEKYSWNKLADEFENVYESVSANRSKG
jgi:glycosyltransferase involved in cell wall biosynthesis